ncbi:MAG: YebC/PmpR family DNA-binding transcriptional regulator [Simkaniaceae bacterium]
MAGHSKWANIKHKKERVDAKKGKIFSRLAKEIISAVKQGGPDPKSNAKLRLVVQKAKAANLPNDLIDRNVKKASESDSSDYSEMTYEIYGHGGVGLIIEAMTDNKNRTASEMRIATNKRGGSIATPGAVAFNFDRKGVIQVNKADALEEALFLLVTDAGAEDFTQEDDLFIIVTPPDALYQVKEVLDAKEIPSEASLDYLPKTYVEVAEELQNANLALIEWLENVDDVDAVYHNMS